VVCGEEHKVEVQISKSTESTQMKKKNKYCIKMKNIKYYLQLMQMRCQMEKKMTGEEKT